MCKLCDADFEVYIIYCCFFFGRDCMAGIDEYIRIPARAVGT